MLIVIAVLFLLGILAYQDTQDKLVDDFYLILLWVIALLFGNLLILVIGFILLWFLTLFPKYRMGWADVLGLPAVASLSILGTPTIIALISTLMILILYAIMCKNKKIPVFAFVFYYWFIFFIASFFYIL